MNVSKKQREELRMMFGGKCAYCGDQLTEKGWHIDHCEPVGRYVKYGEMVINSNGEREYVRYEKKRRMLDRPQNDHKGNLRPSCRLCNINKSSMPLERWRKFLMEGPESLASYNGRFRHMLRLGVVIVNPEPLMFWFEKYRALVPEKENDGIVK